MSLSVPPIIPDLFTADTLLLEAEALNPGPWVAHSRWVADAACRIAAAMPGTDPQAAFILGLLHDIGRRCGVTGMRHIYDGWDYLSTLGFEDAARIALTHSFPVPNSRHIFGKWDVSPQESEFIDGFLASCQFDDYDRIVQLADCLCLPGGFVLIEKRMVDVAMRYGFNEYTRSKWQGYFQIQHDLEARIGCSIYSLLPGVVENTFRTT